MRKFVCYNCNYRWELPHGGLKPNRCPKCGSSNIHRAPEDRGYVRSGQRKGGRGRRY